MAAQRLWRSRKQPKPSAALDGSRAARRGRSREPAKPPRRSVRPGARSGFAAAAGVIVAAYQAQKAFAFCHHCQQKSASEDSAC